MKQTTITILTLTLITSCANHNQESKKSSYVKQIPDGVILFDKTDNNWKDKYGICHTCTPENGFSKDGIMKIETKIKPIYEECHS